MDPLPLKAHTSHSWSNTCRGTLKKYPVHFSRNEIIYKENPQNYARSPEFQEICVKIPKNPKFRTAFEEVIHLSVLLVKYFHSPFWTCSDFGFRLRGPWLSHLRQPPQCDESRKSENQLGENGVSYKMKSIKIMLSFTPFEFQDQRFDGSVRNPSLPITSNVFPPQNTPRQSGRAGRGPRRNSSRGSGEQTRPPPPISGNDDEHYPNHSTRPRYFATTEDSGPGFLANGKDGKRREI